MELIPVTTPRELPEWTRRYIGDPEAAAALFAERYGREPEKAFVFQQTEKITYYYIPLRDEEVGLR